MKAQCPICRTELLERADSHICPRNTIGDCSYDAQSHSSTESRHEFERTEEFGDTIFLKR